MAWLFALITASALASAPPPAPPGAWSARIGVPLPSPRASSLDDPPTSAPDPSVEPDPTPRPPPPTNTPEAQFKAAYDAYIAGDFAGARQGLLALIARDATGDPLPPDVYAEALIYLGEIAYQEGDRDGAEAIFRRLLTRDPTATISAYDHPDYIIGVFELVRGAVIAERQQRPVERRPLPAWGYAPLGVPQFKQNQPIRGALAATFQLGFAATSIASWVWIDQLQSSYAGIEDAPPEAAQAKQTAVLVRGAMSIPSAALFYVTWGASVIDGGATWRRDHRPDLSVGVTPTADGIGLVVGGRW